MRTNCHPSTHLSSNRTWSRATLLLCTSTKPNYMMQHSDARHSYTALTEVYTNYSNDHPRNPIVHVNNYQLRSIQVYCTPTKMPKPYDSAHTLHHKNQQSTWNLSLQCQWQIEDRKCLTKTTIYKKHSTFNNKHTRIYCMQTSMNFLVYYYTHIRTPTCSNHWRRAVDNLQKPLSTISHHSRAVHKLWLQLVQNGMF